VGNGEGPSASKRPKEPLVVKVSTTNSDNSGHTMELLIEDDQEVVETLVASFDATSPKNSAQSSSNNDEVLFYRF
jgi:hypothetical protein